MTYRPTRQTRAPLVPEADSTSAAMPRELGSALSKAETLLEARAASMRRLEQFSIDIPVLLKQAIAARSGEALDRVRIERETAARARQDLIAELRDGESELVAAQGEIDTLRAPYVAALVAAFETRYAAAVAAYQEILSEGQALAACLRCPVPMPLPVSVSLPQKRELAVFDPPPPPILSPVMGDAVSTPDPAAVRLGAAIDGLSEAIAFCSGIRNFEIRARELAAMRYREAIVFDPTGVFIVAKPINDLLTGVSYPPGTLIDSSLVSAGLLLRMVRSGFIRAAGPPAVAASARPWGRWPNVGQERG